MTTQSNWQTNEQATDYMGIINVRCLFRAYYFCINRVLFFMGPLFYGVFISFELVNMRSILLKFDGNFQLSDVQCNRNNQNLKQTKIFRDFRVSDFAQYPKSKTRISREIFFFTSNFEKSCNLDAKKTKNFMRQKLKDQDMFWLEKVKISEVSEFSILPYTQNWKLGNLGKCSFTSNVDSSCNLRCKSDKKLTKAKTWRSRYAFYQNLWKVLIPHFNFKLSQKRTM